jgi:hypothetical protein
VLCKGESRNGDQEREQGEFPLGVVILQQVHLGTPKAQISIPFREWGKVDDPSKSAIAI